MRLGIGLGPSASESAPDSVDPYADAPLDGAAIMEFAAEAALVVEPAPPPPPDEPPPA